MKKRDMVFFAGIIIAVISFIYFLLPKQIYKRAVFFFSNTYMIVVLGALIIASVFIFFRKELSCYLKYAGFFIFMPFVLFPVIRCYFKIPYIFCKSCPRKCPWGLFREFTIPMFLIQNLDNRFWCYKLCPMGNMQDMVCMISKKKICLPRWVRIIRYIILVFVIIVVILILLNIRSVSSNFFYKGEHEPYFIGLIIAGIIFIMTYFIPRFFCNYICPIGSASDLILKAKKRIIKK